MQDPGYAGCVGEVAARLSEQWMMIGASRENQYPRAMALALGMVMMCNVLTIAVGTATDRSRDWSAWHDGHFAEVAAWVGGDWLGWWVVGAAAVSNIGLFEAEMSTNSCCLGG